MSYKSHFSRFLDSLGDELHFAAHSHHLWPDVSFEAHSQAWLDAARDVDEKWDRVLGEVVPDAQAEIGSVLSLRHPENVAFASSTHDLIVRLVSCFESSPVKILTSAGEFHSFERQSRRWEEAGRIEVTRVPVEPAASFAERFVEQASRGEWDLVFVSQVLYATGLVFDALPSLAEALDDDTMLVVDGYHSFMALPISWRELEGRAFFLSGGYKYAMAGEGCCFLACPPGFALRPVVTGWYASFDTLDDGRADRVSYASDGRRLWGATFDPTSIYRLRSVLRHWREQGVDVAAIHEHVQCLQSQFLAAVTQRRAGPLTLDRLRPAMPLQRGHFLTFQHEDAEALQRRLRERGVRTDRRRDLLRIGFGLYQDAPDVVDLIRRLQSISL